MTNQTFAVTPLPLFTVTDGEREPVAGLLGYDFFRRFVVGIDYDKARVSIAPLQACGRERSTAAKLYLGEDRTPQVEATLDGVAGLWMIDVGNAGASFVTQRMATQLGVPADVGAHYLHNGGSGGTQAMRALGVTA